MKIKYIAFLLLILFLGACTAGDTDKLQFTDIPPGEKYENSVPTNSDFLPYTYFKQDYPSEIVVPHAKERWLNINKSDHIVSHVIFKSKPENSNECFEIRDNIIAFLIEHGFYESQPKGAFTNLIAEKGSYLALFTCSPSFANYGTPEQITFPTEMELSITTEAQHHKFEQAMKNIKR